MADHDYLDNLLNTLPDKYRALAVRACTATSSASTCATLVLKLNGKGGQPVYVKVAGQSTRAVRTEMKILLRAQPVVIGAHRYRGRVARWSLWRAEVREAAVRQSGQDLLRLLRRGRRPVHRRRRARSPAIAVGKVSSIELDGARGAGALQGRQEHPAGRAHRGGDQDQEPAGHQGPRGHAARRRTARSAPSRSTRTTSPYQLPDALGDLADTISGLNTDQLSESLATLARDLRRHPADLQARCRAWRGSRRPSTSATPSCATCSPTPTRRPGCWPSAATRSSA